MRYCLMLIAVCGWGATLTFNIKCADAPTAIFDTVAGCTGPTSSALARPLAGLLPSVQANASGDAFAVITFSDTYILTIFGTPGGVTLVQPCFDLASHFNGAGYGGAGTGFFGFVSTDFTGCGQIGVQVPIGVPTGIHVGVSATAVGISGQSGIGIATLTGIKVDGNYSYSFTSIGTPEPASWALMLISLVYLAYLRRSARPVGNSVRRPFHAEI